MREAEKDSSSSKKECESSFQTLHRHFLTPTQFLVLLPLSTFFFKTLFFYSCYMLILSWTTVILLPTRLYPQKLWLLCNLNCVVYPQTVCACCLYNQIKSDTIQQKHLNRCLEENERKKEKVCCQLIFICVSSGWN